MSVKPCEDTSCAACPWRVSNRGKPGPVVEGQTYQWYDKRNLRRLWSGLRAGERMTCHPTDPSMRQANGQFARSAMQTVECAGATILTQRELMILQADYESKPKLYRRARPKGMTTNGLADTVARAVFGGTLMTPQGRPDLNDVDIQYEPLGLWEVRDGATPDDGSSVDIES